MPLSPSTFRAPFPFRNGHLQTIIPALFRRVPQPPYRRERIETSDGDFLDLDRISVNSSRVALLCHGLEGDSGAVYMKGMAQTMAKAGWDVAALNYRGCSGEMNRLPRFYHSGATEDIDTSLRYLLSTGNYSECVLIGFSLGGNQVLKYVGENGKVLLPELSAAVAVSVPCDLAASATQLAKPSNGVYLKRFLKSLKNKIRQKAELFPELLDTNGLESLNDFYQFDDRYTAPLHGFQSAADYYHQCSSIRFLEEIRIPTLLINALNDPYLTPECFPADLARRHTFLHAEFPDSGGHVGFFNGRLTGISWTERRTLEFITTFAAP